jgi:hypothetical protein
MLCASAAAIKLEKYGDLILKATEYQKVLFCLELI